MTLYSEADFKGIAPKFEGSTIRMLPQVEGYEQKWQCHKVPAKHVLDIPLVRAAQPLTLLTGSIVPAPAKEAHIRILVEGQSVETFPDELGRFSLNVSGKPGDTVRLKAYSNNQLVYDDYQPLPGPSPSNFAATADRFSQATKNWSITIISRLVFIRVKDLPACFGEPWGVPWVAALLQILSAKFELAGSGSHAAGVASPLSSGTRPPVTTSRPDTVVQ